MSNGLAYPFRNSGTRSFGVLPTITVAKDSNCPPPCEHPPLKHSLVSHDAVEDPHGALHVILLHQHCPADPLGLVGKVPEQAALLDGRKNN